MDETFNIRGERNHFVLQKIGTRSFGHRQSAQEYSYDVTLKNPNPEVGLADLSIQLQVLFEVLQDMIRQQYAGDGYARLFIEFAQGFFVYFTYVKDFSVEKIMHKLSKTFESAGFISCTSAISIRLAACQPISGKGAGQHSSYAEARSRKRSIICIENTDHLCLPRALVVARAYLQNKKNNNKSTQLVFRQLRRDGPKQKAAAQKLQREAQIPPDAVGTLHDVKRFEKVMKSNIRVLNFASPENVLYPGADVYSDTLTLTFGMIGASIQDGHFDVCTSENAFMGHSFYCQHCRVSFPRKGSHNCEKICGLCGVENCKKLSPVFCDRCNRDCRSEECLERHRKGFSAKKRKVKPICEKFWKCPTCKILISGQDKLTRVSNHICGETWCNSCQEYFLGEHHCYLTQRESKSSSGKYIFFDFECRQDQGFHIPNMVVAQTSCAACCDTSVVEQNFCYNCGFRCSNCDKSQKGVYVLNPCSLECGLRRKVWYGIETHYQFCRWLFSDQNYKAKVFAHNARGYDNYFILNFLVNEGFHPSKVISKGTKLTYMKYGRGLDIEFMDSLNFFPMPLASLPSAFGLTELKKGFFPFLFNTAENENAVMNVLPERKFYAEDSMSVEKRKEFLTWYEANKFCKFDMKQEMSEYCISDVTILQEACMKFRRLVMDVTGRIGMVENMGYIIEPIDPFSFITIASLCMGIFQTLFLEVYFDVLLPENAVENCLHDWGCQCDWKPGKRQTASHPVEVWDEEVKKWYVLKRPNVKIRNRHSKIGCINQNSYGSVKPHSRKALEWLTWMEQIELPNQGQFGVSLKHARNGGEAEIQLVQAGKLVSYFVDGYAFFEEQHHVFEFYGCVWHGCKKCYIGGNRYKPLLRSKSAALLYEETMLRESSLMEAGYKVHSIWECEFDKLKENTERGKEIIDSFQISPILSLRDAYFGGRTNAIVLDKEMKCEEEGHYVDFTSLYPDVLKYQRYPVAHPVKLFNPFWEFKKSPCCDTACQYQPFCTGLHLELPFFGIVKATVVPPANLLYPVLPVRVGKKHAKKLMFPLCYDCALKQSQTPCNCSIHKRQITGTYCTPELNVAINSGYTILFIHEVLHWEKTEQFDPKTGQGGLFTNYINTFLKLKQEASGYPKGVETAKQKKKVHPRILSTRRYCFGWKKITKNPGLRFLAKLCLNSFYGKFGQRTDLLSTEFVKTEEHFHAILNDPKKEVRDFMILARNIIQISYKPASSVFETEDGLGSKVNVPIAAFCTCYARIKLLYLLNQLHGRVLYHDTDSVIFTHHPGMFYPKLGNFLGELTNELSCKDVGCPGCKEGHFIKKFVSCGPKNYSYVLNTGQVFTKVKGFGLNYNVAKLINFDSMRESLHCWKTKDESKIVTVTTEIRREPSSVQIVTKQVKKSYGVVFDKRVAQEDFSSLPYGFL